MITIKQKKIKNLQFVFKTYESDLLGVKGKDLFIKIACEDDDTRFIVLQIPQSEYFKLLKEYFTEKKNYCDMYGHFCGVFGYHIPYEFSEVGSQKIWMHNAINGDPYYLEVPVVQVTKWSKPDMEHG